MKPQRNKKKKNATADEEEVEENLNRVDRRNVRTLAAVCCFFAVIVRTDQTNRHRRSLYEVPDCIVCRIYIYEYIYACVALACCYYYYYYHFRCFYSFRCVHLFLSFCASASHFLIRIYVSSLNWLEPAPIFVVISYNELFKVQYSRRNILSFFSFPSVVPTFRSPCVCVF